MFVSPVSPFQAKQIDSLQNKNQPFAFNL